MRIGVLVDGCNKCFEDFLVGFYTVSKGDDVDRNVALAQALANFGQQRLHTLHQLTGLRSSNVRKQWPAHSLCA